MSGIAPAVSVVIPALAEGRLLRWSVEQLSPCLPDEHELLLVANGADRPTIHNANHVARSLEQATALIFPRRLGKGGAILRGLAQARGQVLGFVDADGPFAPERVANELVRPVLQGEVDGTLASKWLGLRYDEVTSYTLPTKKMLSRGLNRVTRRAFDLPFADTQGGAKFFSRRAWASIDHDFVCKGFDFDVELLWKLRHAGFNLREVHLPPYHSVASSFRFREMAPMAMGLARLLMTKNRLKPKS